MCCGVWSRLVGHSLHDLNVFYCQIERESWAEHHGAKTWDFTLFKLSITEYGQKNIKCLGLKWQTKQHPHKLPFSESPMFSGSIPSAGNLKKLLIWIKNSWTHTNYQALFRWLCRRQATMSAAVRLVQVHHDLCERHTFVKHKNNNDYRLSANSNSSHNNILNFELRQQLGKTTEESGYLPSWVKIF